MKNEPIQKTHTSEKEHNLEQKIVQHILENYQPRAIILHGSRASGNAVEKSDWDFVLLVDEIKPLERGFVEGENVEFSQAKLPIEPADAFKKFGIKFRKGGVKIVYDPDTIAAPLVAACQNEIEKGFEMTPEDITARRAFMEGMLSKIERYENEEFIRLPFVGEFLSRAMNSWFPTKEKRYSVPPYEALPYVTEKDPEFINMLNDFANAKGPNQYELGEKILNYLLG
jgi:hypothetical protein